MATHTAMKPDDHYIIISADTHAGGSHAQYREYLDPAYLDDFDAWRNRYKNPFKDLRDTSDRVRNWDDERRWRDMGETDGVVGEVVFPNTVPPFFPSFVLFAAPPAPEDYEHRLAGIRAHNRWLVDFVAEFPARRAGVGQIFVNDIDDALDDARWVKEHGLRGGILLPNVPPDVKWVKPLHDRYYDPLWELCEDLEIPVQCHGGTGNPDYGNTPVSGLLYITETGFYSQRPLVHMLLGGVFERFPKLKVVLTEMGCAWIPGLLAQLDGVINSIRSTRSIGELRYTDDQVLNHTATEYVQRNVWVGASQPRPPDAAAREVLGEHRFMWGSDYPHDEGTHPFTREHLRQVFSDTPPDELQRILAGNAAEVFDFDLDALQPEADRYGPTVAELAQPLTELPEDANQALRRGAGATM
jgi:predicted TIM-barrel fold metal-dependent hydrolase